MTAIQRRRREGGGRGGELASDTPHNPNGPTYCILLVPWEAHVDVCILYISSALGPHQGLGDGVCGRGGLLPGLQRHSVRGQC